jgi:CheY-like chemotaxis protein
LVNPAVRGSGERVLLLDDEPILAVAVERRLRALGYEVVACTTPQAALDAFAADPSGIDLVLTDYSMPDMNGFELARRITEVSGGVPIVMVTGFVDDLDPDRLEESGIVAVLKKPTTVEEMAGVLHKALGKPA